MLGRKSGALTAALKTLRDARRSRSGKRFGAARQPAQGAVRGGLRRAARRRSRPSGAGAEAAGVDLTMPGRAALGRRGAPGDPGGRRDRRDLPRARLRRRRRARGRDRVVQLPRAQLPRRPPGDGHARHALPRRAAGRRASRAGRLLLRTHTSPVQIRDDARGAAADPRGHPGHGLPQRRRSTPRTRRPSRRSRGSPWTRAISFVDLKATLTHFAHRFFSPTTKMRFRPSFFPFTEPSAEMDVECQLCHGSGCPACKGTGWMEILGCGMVHPAVLENVQLDPERYTGWAFGMGPHRIAMLRYGVPDIRLLLEGDMRFLEQVGRPGATAVNISLRWLEAFLRRRARRGRTSARRLAMLGRRRSTPSSRCTPSWATFVVGLVRGRCARIPTPTGSASAPVNDGSARAPPTWSAARPTSRRARSIRSPGSAPVPAARAARRSKRAAKLRGERRPGDALLRPRARPGRGARRHPRARHRRGARARRCSRRCRSTTHRLVVDVTPNRPDLLGHKGVARELSASLRRRRSGCRRSPAPSRSTCRRPAAPAPAGTVGGVRVAIEDAEACPRFHARRDPRRHGGPVARVAPAPARGGRASARSTTWWTPPTT